MTEQPAAVVETPNKRRFRIPLPRRSTLARVAALTGVFTLGAWVGWRRAKDACDCESDTAENAGTTLN